MLSLLPDPALGLRHPTTVRLTGGRVRYYQTPEINVTAIPVRSDGNISVELLGDVEAAGSTTDELTARLVAVQQPCDVVYMSMSTIASIDTFAKQYIRDLLQVQPVLPTF